MFSYAYKSNYLERHDKLDSVGKKIDEWGSKAKETAGNAIDFIGETFNPMNWEW